ncbi:unnamed protein product, partial [Porites lobata]
MIAARVLSISGLGSIYLRPDKVLHKTSEEVDGDSDLDRCPWDTQEDDLEDVKTPERPPTPEPQTVADSDGLPSTSSGASAMDQEKGFLVLKEMFPETKEEVLKLAYDCSNSLEEAASFLADRSSSPELESKSSHMSLELLIEELRGKMSDAFDRKKLRVDDEDLVADAVAFYKRPDFDPKAGVRVVYSGQPASDTGGVSHAFSDFLHRLSQIYFSGESRKVPLYNTDILISGLLKIIGTIIVHSVLHGGPGFPFFSSALYWYLATGSVDAAIQQLCFDDCANPNYKDVVLKEIQNAQNADEISTEEAIINVMSECGLTMFLKNENKTSVIQAILFHDAIGRTKTALDQLRDGLCCLGFLEKMNKYPVLFEELFVFKGSSLTSEAVVNRLTFPTSMDNEEKRMFLTFVTGAPCLPYFGLQTLSVKFSDHLSLLPLVCVRLHCQKCLLMKIILSCLLKQFCKHVESHLIV